MIAVLVLTVGDLWYWNMADNPLAFSSSTFAERYGDPFKNFQDHIAAIKQQPLSRIWSAFDTNAFGPLNSPLEGRSEVTYGYTL